MVKWRQLIYMCMAVFVSLTIGCEDDLGLREGLSINLLFAGILFFLMYFYDVLAVVPKC